MNCLFPDSFQPAWAAQAHLLAMAGRNHDAVMALDCAIAMTTGPRVRDELVERRERLLSASVN